MKIKVPNASKAGPFVTCDEETGAFYVSLADAPAEFTREVTKEGSWPMILEDRDKRGFLVGYEALGYKDVEVTKEDGSFLLDFIPDPESKAEDFPEVELIKQDRTGGRAP